MSQATDILELLKGRAQAGGYVKLTTPSIAEETGYSVHDVNKVLFDLKSRGAVKFKEKKGGPRGGLILSQIRVQWKGIKNLNGENLPETKMREMDGLPVGTAPMTDEEPAVTVNDKPLPQYLEEVEGRDVPPAESPAPRPATPPQARYPTLINLLDRKRLAEDAAKNLEALGADSLALQALELATAPLTPLQKEIAEFFARNGALVGILIRDNEKYG